MKTIRLSIIFFLTLISCNHKDKKTNSIDNKTIKPIITQDTSDLETCYFYNESNLEYPKQVKNLSINYRNISGHFELIPTYTDDFTLSSIDVFIDKQKQQTITHNEEFVKIEWIDWNFDGYKDLSILENAGATGNTSYSVWLFNPMNKKFEKNEYLNSKSSFIDTVKHFVISHHREGADFEFWEYYKFEKSKLIFDHSKKKELVSYKGKRAFETTLSKNVQGKIIVEDSYEFLN
jgi:hypothetical protein